MCRLYGFIATGPTQLATRWHSFRIVSRAESALAMAEKSASQASEKTPVSTPVRRSCFDATFFSVFLGERTRALCAQQPHTTAVVLLHLADGAVLDLCHIEQLFPDWMAASVYHDPKTCDRMDLVFLPYAFITRVVLSLPSVHERRIGFQMHEIPPP